MIQNSALIGYTGFVGSHFNDLMDFSYKYNSKNSSDMCHQEFDLVVCAGFPAVVWFANQNPDKDWADIQKLLNHLKTIKTKHFILISTVSVYPNPQNVSEFTPIDETQNLPYGKHRYLVEKWVQDHFSSVTILRLPGLYGKGLKKNVIFDLLNDNCLEMIQKESTLQYYNLSNIVKDMIKAQEHSIPLLNLACEPIKHADLINKFFPHKTVGQKPGVPAHFNMQSDYAYLWGNDNNPYLYTQDYIWKDLENFISRQYSVSV